MKCGSRLSSGLQLCDSREDQPKLRKLAEQTGGRAYFPAKNEELESILTQVELNLRVQYIVSFRSGSERNIDPVTIRP